ncbi:MAG: hypothetical protein Q9193_006352, partial [Seirophora villosa]
PRYQPDFNFKHPRQRATSIPTRPLEQRTLHPQLQALLQSFPPRRQPTVPPTSPSSLTGRHRRRSETHRQHTRAPTMSQPSLADGEQDRRQRRALQTAATFFERQYETEKTNRRAAEEKLHAVSREVAGAEARVASYRNHIFQEANRYAKLEKKTSDYEHEIAKLELKCNKLKKDNQKLESDAAELKRKCRGLEKENQKLMSEASEAPTNDGAPTDDAITMTAGRTGEASQEEAPVQPNAPAASGTIHACERSRSLIKSIAPVSTPSRSHDVSSLRPQHRLPSLDRDARVQIAYDSDEQLTWIFDETFHVHQALSPDVPDQAPSTVVGELDVTDGGQPRTRGSDRQEQAQTSSEDGPGINDAGEATPVDDRQDEDPDEFTQGGWIYLQLRTQVYYSWIEGFLERQAQLMENLVFLVKDVPLMRADLFQLKKESSSLREEIGKLNDREFPPVETDIPHMIYPTEPRPNLRSQDCGDEVRRGVKELEELLRSLECLLKAQRDHCYRLEEDRAALVDHVRCLRLYVDRDPDLEESRAEESRAEESRAEESRAEEVGVAHSIKRSLDEIHSRNSSTEEGLRGLESLVKAYHEWACAKFVEVMPAVIAAWSYRHLCVTKRYNRIAWGSFAHGLFMFPHPPPLQQTGNN